MEKINLNDKEDLLLTDPKYISGRKKIELMYLFSVVIQFIILWLIMNNIVVSRHGAGDFNASFALAFITAIFAIPTLLSTALMGGICLRVESRFLKEKLEKGQFPVTIFTALRIQLWIPFFYLSIMFLIFPQAF